MNTTPNPFASPDYEKFLSDGGSFEAIIPASDLRIDEEFEQALGAKKLSNGFELPPTPMALDSKSYFELVNYGDSFTRAFVWTYGNNGKVTFYRLSDGAYRVVFDVP